MLSTFKFCTREGKVFGRDRDGSWAGWAKEKEEGEREELDEYVREFGRWFVS